MLIKQSYVINYSPKLSFINGVKMFKKLSIGLVFVWLLSGCQSTLMERATEQVLTNAKSGKAQVVFMRSSFVGGAIQASIFDVTKPEPKFIGILSNKTKIAYDVLPGEHMFMVVGESADFLKATVAEDKTYYTIVTPRMGFWKARFSLYPVRNDTSGKFQYNSNDFNEMLDETHFVKGGIKANQWAQDNALSINEKFKKYLPEWLLKDINKKQQMTMSIIDHL
jgi:hypothetical protein